MAGEDTGTVKLHVAELINLRDGRGYRELRRTPTPKEMIAAALPHIRQQIYANRNTIVQAVERAHNGLIAGVETDIAIEAMLRVLALYTVP